MIIQVKIKDRTFSVDIQDLQARPIIASVDGKTYEVWPDENQQILPEQSKRTARSNISEPSNLFVLAPIPGVITALSVRPGAEVVIGQELCILEAMKMKNIIRSPRAGIIGSIHVSTGENVKYQEILMEYES